MKIKKMYQGTVPENKILNTYSDSQTDVYSCDYLNKLNTYSTTEQRIGTWFDKPLYRKIIEKNNFALNSGMSFEHNIPNIDTVIFKKGSFMLKSYNQTRNFPISSSTGTIVDFYADRSNITIVGDDNWVASTDRYIYFILEYTKTTD